ncbi:MAG: phosphotransferase [Planctomycetes bacterium]|nr:phosphotransferase [Planctomycetota bacterium]
MLPSTFKVIRRGRSTVFARTEYQEEVLRERDAADAEECASGRGAVRAYPMVDGGRMLVRTCRRGGFLGRFVSDLFLGCRRVVREIVASEHGREKGMPTALLLGATCERVLGPMVRVKVITREISDSCDLISYCESEQERAAYPGKGVLIPAIAQAVRRMHDAGITHADLHLKNILIDKKGRAYIIDLDKATIHRPVSVSRRKDNLLRLDRSIRKWRASRGMVTTADRLRFLTAYAGGDEGLRSACREMFRTERSYPLHRFFWKLMGIE